MAQSDESTPAALKQKPSWLISQTSVHAHRLLTTALAAANARGYHYRLLAALQAGPASQAVLGRRAGLDRSDVVAVLDELVDRGLVKRSADPVDRRRNIVTITPAGRAQFRRLEKILAGVQDELLRPLSPAQRQQLVRLLTRVLEYHADESSGSKPKRI